MADFVERGRSISASVVRKVPALRSESKPGAWVGGDEVGDDGVDAFALEFGAGVVEEVVGLGGESDDEGVRGGAPVMASVEDVGGGLELEGEWAVALDLWWVTLATRKSLTAAAMMTMVASARCSRTACAHLFGGGDGDEFAVFGAGEGGGGGDEDDAGSAVRGRRRRGRSPCGRWSGCR